MVNVKKTGGYLEDHPESEKLGWSTERALTKRSPVADDLFSPLAGMILQVQVYKARSDVAGSGRISPVRR